MKPHAATTLAIIALSLVGCQPTPRPLPPPPRAEIIPTKLEKHGHVRVDSYYWLRERENPKVLEYLEAENAYLDTAMAHTRALQETLYQEIKRRMKQTDMSVPTKLDDYWYYSRYEEGKEYPLTCRKKGSLQAAEEILIDANALAEGHGFFSLDNYAVSYKQDILAFATDTVGRRFYNIVFKDLSSGKMLPDVVSNATANIAWANDNRTLFYARQDPATLRSYRVYAHILGTDATRDRLVYEEQDETFQVGVFRTKSKKYLMIASTHTLRTEYRALDASTPGGAFRVILPREGEHEYSVDHFGDYFYILTNDRAKNFRLVKTPVNATGKEHWTDVIPHRNDVLLQEIEIFRDHLVLSERKRGLTTLRVKRWDGTSDHYLEFGEPTYAAYIGANPDIASSTLRYVYTSLVTPNSVFDYDMESRSKTLLKQDEVVGGYDASAYRSERLYARAGDGTEVPISLVYKVPFERDGSRPLLLYGYGSYGASMDASFSSARLSLLDRGCAYAIAHVRGGEEMGRQWYEDGKLLKKKNTFTDFIASAQYLVDSNYTSTDGLFAMGGSAGGLLMGAVLNMRPDLFRGVIAAVPFVDVMSTMLDPSIPLTTAEYDEWGNPNDKQYYDYMLSYSPYDNVEAKAYPNILVTTGLHDSQVQYWEPAKWVAKLRELKTDDNILLLKTNMQAGHGGASGRFRRVRETALQYAFVLDLAGLTR